MWRKYLYLVFFLSYIQSGLSQQINLRFFLIDEETEEPISGAHVFVNDSSVGDISNDEGFCEINVSPRENQNFIISHISYGTLVVDPKHYPLLTDNAVLTMKSNGVDINAIQVTAKRSRKWKKNYEKFKEALFGIGTPATKCEILNPEVLRFNKHKDTLTVNAIDVLKIDNNYLGYDILFWLESLIIEPDGSKYYKGKGQFIDKENAQDSKHIKQREKSYQNSLPHFLHSLISSKDNTALSDLGYEISIDRYKKKKFNKISVPSVQELIKKDEASGYYQLHFSDFLTVNHLELIETHTFGTQVSISLAEQQNFGSGRTQSLGAKKQTAISRLYKLGDYLKFDIRGNVINKIDMREYGYWADQGLATTLPVDYKKFSDFELHESSISSIDTLAIFKNLVGLNNEKKEEALKFIQDNWSSSFVAPLLDVRRLSNVEWQKEKIGKLLKQNVPEIKTNYYDAIQWVWQNENKAAGFYSDFKAYLYSTIDPAFNKYFLKRGHQSKIRIDEILWGGVLQDGIPPLRSPNMLSAADADYLGKDNVIFGLLINGKAYAYPKRILAWHEFFTDDIHGQSIAGVYCTLCGTVIVYNAEFDGVKHDLGTSGFLYRSNKLMYDKATQSLWSTIEGKPVMGPLTDKGIELDVLPIETTTWGEWQKKHPNTLVLSLETGYDRNYAEGEAYKNYYATDALMFPTPKIDMRLNNKARVFIPRVKDYKNNPLAISIKYLQKHRLYTDHIGDQKILFLTEGNGACRAYAVGDHKFKSYKNGVLLDEDGQQWDV
ncbi:MAG: DUF3179 domain-containing protein, partial [Saprospiraceae bacterium]|nr:DUF3179 domain-containing protein [Saprospiraceae bacterium]